MRDGFTGFVVFLLFANSVVVHADAHKICPLDDSSATFKSADGFELAICRFDGKQLKLSSDERMVMDEVRVFVRAKSGKRFVKIIDSSSTDSHILEIKGGKVAFEQLLVDDIRGVRTKIVCDGLTCKLSKPTCDWKPGKNPRPEAMERIKHWTRPGIDPKSADDSGEYWDKLIENASLSAIYGDQEAQKFFFEGTPKGIPMDGVVSEAWARGAHAVRLAKDAGCFSKL